MQSTITTSNRPDRKTVSDRRRARAARRAAAIESAYLLELSPRARLTTAASPAFCS